MNDMYNQRVKALNDQEQNQMDNQNHQIACNIYTYKYIDIYKYHGGGLSVDRPAPLCWCAWNVCCMHFVYLD